MIDLEAQDLLESTSRSWGDFDNDGDDDLMTGGPFYIKIMVMEHFRIPQI